MRKIIFMTVSVIVIMLLTACGGPAQVDDETAKKYTEKAREVVSLLNGGENEAVYAMFNDEMKEELPVADMEEQITPVINESGKFEEINKSAVEKNEGYYIVNFSVKYSEKDRIYTISYHEEDEGIGGLFIK